MDEELKKIMEQNLALTKEIHESAKKMDKFIFWYQFLSWAKLILIIAPLIVALIYLPPYLKEALDALNAYKDLLK